MADGESALARGQLKCSTPSGKRKEAKKRNAVHYLMCITQRKIYYFYVIKNHTNSKTV